MPRRMPATHGVGDETLHEASEIGQLSSHHILIIKPKESFGVPRDTVTAVFLVSSFPPAQFYTSVRGSICKTAVKHAPCGEEEGNRETG
jgi:hypothetical protein